MSRVQDLPSQSNQSSAKLSPELIQKIKDSVNIIELIGEHVVLKKSGTQYTGLCPFHSERSPSFSVSEQKQLYHCYGCKQGGDLVSFVMDLHGLSFYEAIQDLAQRAGIRIPSSRGKGEEGASATEAYELAYRFNRFCASYFRGNLKSHPEAQAYLDQRKVNAEASRLYYFGSAREGWDHLSRKLIESKAPLDVALKLGLIRKSQKSGNPVPYFDLFRERVMLPILDLRGRVCGFGGRSLSSDSSQPKYLNSPDSFIFKKGKLLFGLYQAKKYIREQNQVIFVEGFFDVLALHRAGMKNVVATCGTSLTVDHLRLVKRFADQILLVFDGDSAGVHATEAAMELGLKEGMILSGMDLPSGQDPDDYVSRREQDPGGLDELKARIQNAQPLLDQRILATIDEMRESSQSPAEAKSRALKKIGRWLSLFADPVGRGTRIEALEQQMGISRQLIEKAVASRGSAPLAVSASAREPVKKTVRVTRQPSRERAPSGSPTQTLSEAEKTVLQGLVRWDDFRDLLEEFESKMPPGKSWGDFFLHQVPKDFTIRWVDQVRKSGNITGDWSKNLIGELDAQVRSTISEAFISPHPPISETDLKVALMYGLKRLWARISQEVRTALVEAEIQKDISKHEELMKEYLDVQRKMKEFENFYG